MTDKAIGELWLRDGWNVASPVRGLIRTLVKERAQVYYNLGHGSWLQCERKARSDFGIPEESWPK